MKPEHIGQPIPKAIQPGIQSVIRPGIKSTLGPSFTSKLMSARTPEQKALASGLRQLRSQTSHDRVTLRANIRRERKEEEKP
jgi:hypothetical protein